jgi:ABC-type glycerol-3-phosphate transport system substrate-binding protein
MKKKMLFGILGLLVAGSMAGCEKTSVTQQGASDNEIITTTPVDQEKTMITVRVEFGAGQSYNLEQLLEEQFPDVDIVLRHDGSSDSVYTIKANLEAGVECDLILSRRLSTISDIAHTYLLDLSAESFVDDYYMTAVDSCADSEGNLYYLPGPMDVYGIVYDKTMFEEYGWEVPHSYSEFLELLDTISQDTEDVVPLQVSMMYPDMFQILFNTYSYEQVYAGRENYQWLDAYQSGEGSMVGHMEPAVDTFKQLVEDGILSLGALEVTPTERSEMMYVDHTAAMIIECQNAISYSDNYNSDHEVAMMPFWTSDSGDGDFLYGIPSYYMAINRSAAEESEEKKEILLEIFNYLSSVEGQEMLIGEDFQVSNVVGVPLNENEFSEEIIQTIGKGQVINNFYFAEGENNKQVERQMLSTAADMLNGDMSVSDWLLAADQVRDQFLAGTLSSEESYGQVESTMTRLETAYTMAQMYAQLMDTSIGICQGGGWNYSTNGYLYKGDITDSSLACLNPEKEQEAEESWAGCIVTATLTGQQIIDILNDATESSTTKGLYVYYVAYGLQVEFDPWGDAGERVISCKLADGTELDLNGTYEVAYFNGSLPETDILPERGLECSWQEAFLQWLDTQGGVLKTPKMTLKLEYQALNTQ